MKKGRYYQKSLIRLRAALILNAVVLANSLFATIIGVYFSNREITRTVSQNLSLVGRIAADIGASSIAKIKDDIGYVSSMLERAYEAGGDERLLETIKNEVEPGPNFISLAVVFSDGRIVSGEKVNFEYAAPPRSQALEFFNNAPPSGSRVANSSITESGKHVIRCYQKINNDAVTIFTLRGTYFSHLITESNYGIYNAGKIFLVDGNGYVIADSDQTKINTRYVDDEDGLSQLVTKILAGSDDEGAVARYHDKQAGVMICAYTPILHDSEKWVLFISAPLSETPIKTMRDIFIIAGIIFLIFGALSSIFLSAMQAKPYDELNRKNEQLEKLKIIAENASSVKSEFLSNMSHEIRTPLNAVIGMTAIGKSAADIARKDYCFGKIEDASTHLLGVINDILDMSKIEAGKLELSPDVFNFEAMIKRVSDVITFKIDEKHQQFKVTIDPNIPRFLTGDDQRLAQVITNLLSNAVKFTPENGSITLNSRLLEKTEGDEHCIIQIEVSDSGIGISKEQQTRLFSSFQQAESNTSRKFGGTGLGLAISKRIVEMMGGKIWIESEPGHGSTFAFTIQAEISNDDANKENISEESPLGKTPVEDFSAFRLLLAEDIDINREIIIALLENTHIAIDCAENGVIALQLFKDAPDKYDIIFMDVQMPEMDGYEATRQIRAFENSLRSTSLEFAQQTPKQQLESAQRIPIVAMTANVFREDIEKCLEAGMDAHVGKPLALDDMIDKMKTFLKKD
ncbi:MAG: response regulator [Treponema sp.]|jgi:signal transduction histidine kinase/AmiR/NasT family two-component response regulator|nr:response regulator [Treponema sp.]